MIQYHYLIVTITVLQSTKCATHHSTDSGCLRSCDQIFQHGINALVEGRMRPLLRSDQVSLRVALRMCPTELTVATVPQVGNIQEPEPIEDVLPKMRIGSDVNACPPPLVRFWWLQRLHHWGSCCCHCHCIAAKLLATSATPWLVVGTFEVSLWSQFRMHPSLRRKLFDFFTHR